MKRLKGLHRGGKGFTLIELMVVMAILAILAGIVVPAVTGTGTAGRGTQKTMDINSTQKAVETFNGDANDSGYPTSTRLLPSGTPGLTDISVDGKKAVAIDWRTLTDTTDATSKAFVPGFLREKPANADGTIAAGSSTIDGKAVVIPTGGGAIWVLDADGFVHALIADENY